MGRNCSKIEDNCRLDNMSIRVIANRCWPSLGFLAELRPFLRAASLPARFPHIRRKFSAERCWTLFAGDRACRPVQIATGSVGIRSWKEATLDLVSVLLQPRNDAVVTMVSRSERRGVKS